MFKHLTFKGVLKKKIKMEWIYIWNEEVKGILPPNILLGKGLIIYNRCKVCGGLVFPHLSENRPLAIQHMLNKYGDWYITQITIAKRQLSPILEKLANIVTFGKYEKNKKEIEIDKYFHIYMILTLKNPNTDQIKNIKLEKEARVKWSDNGNIEKGSEVVEILFHKTITLNNFINAGEEYNKKYDNKHKIYIYDAISSNCQHFIKDMLISNDLWDPTLEKFVIQDVNSAVPSYLGKIIKTGTNIAHRIDYARMGGIKKGAGKRITNKQLRKMLRIPIRRKKYNIR